jgi:glycosyltransferase involved in cell wall biosynthesis
MHAVIVDTTLTTPPTGGAQTFLIELCRALVFMDWQVSIVTQPGREHAIVDSLRRVGAKIHDDIWRRTHLPEERGRALATWVNSVKPDVYVVSISPDTGWLALPSLDPAIPTVSIAHNDVGAFYEPLNYYHLFIDAAVGVSETIHRKIIEQCNIAPERATQIPYGVNSLALAEVDQILKKRAGREVLRICYLGRLAQHQKRVLEFVPLATELVKSNVAFELHLIGDGSERNELETQFRDLGLDDRVTIWGWLTPEEIAAKLVELDAFVLLSDHEGLPVALLEAMAHSLVPIVTNIESGNTQVVQDGQNGFVVPVGDVKLAVDRLKQLGENRDLLLRMRRAAWQTSQKFSCARMVERYLSCFAEVKMNTRDREHRSGVHYPYPPMPSCRSPYPFWLRKLKARFLNHSETPDLQPRTLF